MLDYDSEDIDGMDDDAREEQAENPPFTGRWTTTSSYDVYMVDTPIEDNGDNEKNPVEDKPPEIQPKNRRQRRRSKSRHSKSSIPAQETITLQIVPKTTTIPCSQTSSGRMNKLALRNKQQTENQRMTITCLSPKTK